MHLLVGESNRGSCSLYQHHAVGDHLEGRSEHLVELLVMFPHVREILLIYTPAQLLEDIKNDDLEQGI